MNSKLSATYVRRRFNDSGRDQAPDYFIYEFTDIVDSDNNKLNNKWFKETKLIKEASMQKGKRYEILLSERPYSFDAVNLPFPFSISCDKERVYIKSGNSIIRVDKKGKETNVSYNPFAQEMRKAKMEYKKNQATKK